MIYKILYKLELKCYIYKSYCGEASTQDALAGAGVKVPEHLEWEYELSEEVQRRWCWCEQSRSGPVRWSLTPTWKCPLVPPHLVDDQSMEVLLLFQSEVHKHLGFAEVLVPILQVGHYPPVGHLIIVGDQSNISSVISEANYAVGVCW